jgi:hypothetical protein
MEQVQEFTQAADLTESEKRVIALVEKSRSVRLDELKSNLVEVRNLLGVGRLRLTMTQYLWGMEFKIEMNSSQPSTVRLEKGGPPKR